MSAAHQKQSWQEALSDLITDPRELWELLALDPVLLEQAVAASRLFPLKMPRRLVSRMERGNPHDPLLKQFLPLGVELTVAPGYSHDPLEEANANPVPGVLHKYHGRVLVTLTSACAVHCRYCFRRHFPYAENNPGRQGWEKIISYLAADETISEVILSGGDPLSVSDRLLKEFTDQLNKASNIKRLRIHTRLPVVLPERITHSFIEWLRGLKQQVVIVLHVNHPREIDAELKKALSLLRNENIMLLNQSVLLKDINDNAETLAELSESLFSVGVLPYYLHLLDKVQGAAHFDVSEDLAIRLHSDIQKKLPGYLVPRLVREDAGELSKTIIIE